MKFLMWLMLTFTPPLIFYLLGNFISWGENWNPANWTESSRLFSGIFLTVWGIIMSLMVLGA